MEPEWSTVATSRKDTFRSLSSPRGRITTLLSFTYPLAVARNLLSWMVSSPGRVSNLVAFFTEESTNPQLEHVHLSATNSSVKDSSTQFCNVTTEDSAGGMSRLKQLNSTTDGNLKWQDRHVVVDFIVPEKMSWFGFES